MLLKHVSYGHHYAWEIFKQSLEILDNENLDKAWHGGRGEVLGGNLYDQDLITWSDTDLSPYYSSIPEGISQLFFTDTNYLEFLKDPRIKKKNSLRHLDF